MQTEPATAAASVDLLPLGVADAPLVQALLDRMTGYTTLVHGVPTAPDGARAFLLDRPPGTAPSAKHAFAVLAGGEPVGLVDLIAGHPGPGTAFVGLLALAEDRRGAGLGRAAYERAEAFARDELGAVTLRLAVVSGNRVRGFWRAMGFVETGEVRTFEGAAARHDAALMEKRLVAPTPGPG